VTERLSNAPDTLKTYTFGIVSVLATLALLAEGRGLLIPLAIAAVLWFVIEALAGLLARWGLPRGLAVALSSLIILGVAVGVARIVTDNIAEVIGDIPRYQRQAERVLAALAGRLPMDVTVTWPDLLASDRIQGLLRNVAGGFASFIGSLGLVLAYILFLYLSQRTFAARLGLALRDPDRRARARAVIARIQRQIRTYLWAKTLMSLLTALISAVILLLAGVDYPLFWAFWIFLLNFVPYLGSLLGVVLPTLQALIQFDSLLPVLAVMAALAAVQITIDNVVEPQFMGRTLNVDPLVVMVALVLWGSLWGMVGIFLAVPLTGILIIILSQIEGTRWIAILLSRDGELDKVEA